MNVYLNPRVGDIVRCLKPGDYKYIWNGQEEFQVLDIQRSKYGNWNIQLCVQGYTNYYYAKNFQLVNKRKGEEEMSEDVNRIPTHVLFYGKGNSTYVYEDDKVEDKIKNILRNNPAARVRCYKYDQTYVTPEPTIQGINDFAKE